jgi:hypothetical protein
MMTSIEQQSHGFWVSTGSGSGAGAAYGRLKCVVESELYLTQRGSERQHHFIELLSQ